MLLNSTPPPHWPYLKLVRTPVQVVSMLRSHDQDGFNQANRALTLMLNDISMLTFTGGIIP